VIDCNKAHENLKLLLLLLLFQSSCHRYGRYYTGTTFYLTNTVFLFLWCRSSDKPQELSGRPTRAFELEVRSNIDQIK